MEPFQEPEPKHERFSTLYEELLGRSERMLMEDDCDVPELLMILEEVRTTIRERYIVDTDPVTEDNNDNGD
jgi:hypothetical protein